MATQDLTDFPYTNPTVPLRIYFGSLIYDDNSWNTLIGLIPAQIAVKVRPIEALREE